jgi:formylmethanofuran dehydrogenase subunit D
VKNRVSKIEVIWLSSLQLLAQTTKNLQKLRIMSDSVAEKWIKKHGLVFKKKVDTYDAAVSCAELLNETFSDTVVFEITKMGETIRIRMESQPIYNSVYMNTKRKGMKIFSLDAPIFINALQKMTGREFRSSLVEFNTDEEVIDLLPLEVGMNVLLSMATAKGTIKINEEDSKELGLGIIDKVVINHEKTGNTFIAMSYSSSKIPKGAVLISMGDAESIGYSEGDKVRVEKSGKEKDEDMDGNEDQHNM